MTNTKTQKVYLTKRRINRASRKGIREASILAMETSGSVVAVEGSWVIRKYKDGTVKKIEELHKTPKAHIQEKVSKLARN
jgi:hypothetical protein